jgi:peptidoglycan-associated lipoprotein
MNKIFSTSLFVLAILAAMLSAGCKSKGSIVSAREHYKKKEYFLSSEDYKAVYSKTKVKEEKLEAVFKTAECYRLMNDIKSAESWYAKTVKADPKNAEAQLRYALALKNNASADITKYSAAIIEFNKYKKLGDASCYDEAAIDREIKGCEYALKWKNEKSRYMVENIRGINTKWEDFAPQQYKKDQLFFTSDREKGVSGTQYGWTGNGHTDVYVSTFKVNKKNPNDVSFGLPNLLDKDKVNTKYNDGVVCFDSKFTTMYVTQCNSVDGKGNRCRLYVSKLNGTEWSKPEPLPFSTDSFSCGHPSLSKDGQVLYFASDMPGSTPKLTCADNPEGTTLSKDLWMVTYTKRSNTWGDPVNLGPAINTPGDEMYPYIHEDGMLYFSSTGHPSLGGSDIYYTKGEAADWSSPVNMKSPINSSGDDFAMQMFKDKEGNHSGYFSSNRDGGKGSDDIYRFYMNPLIFNLSGVVRDSKTKALLTNTLITITSSNDTGKVTLMTDATGSYRLKIKAKTDYELFASKEYYFDSKIAFQTTKGLEQSTDLVQDFDLGMINITDVFTVKGIYYDLDKADIRPDAAKVLDSLALVLNKYSKVKIELGSHTDCRADSLYNIGLSQRRADSAVSYLIRQGIDSTRLVSRGYGENKLAVEKCKCEGPDERSQGQKCTEEEHQLNRRTTVQILDINFIKKPKEVPVDPKKSALPQGKPRGGVTTPAPRR